MKLVFTILAILSVMAIGMAAQGPLSSVSAKGINVTVMFTNKTNDTVDFVMVLNSALTVSKYWINAEQLVYNSEGRLIFGSNGMCAHSGLLSRGYDMKISCKQEIPENANLLIVSITLKNDRDDLQPFIFNRSIQVGA